MQIDPAASSEECYSFQYIEDKPETLTMTKMPSEIMPQIYWIPIYIWIDQDHLQRASQRKQVEENAGVTFICCSTVEQACQEIEKNKFAVVIAQDIFCEEIQKKLCVKSRVNQVICFPSAGDLFDRLRKDKRVGKKFVLNTNDVNEVTKHLNEETKFFIQSKSLNNFISLKSEVWSSSTLMKAMVVMLKQDTNRKMLVEELAKVARSLPRFSESDVQEFINDAADPMSYMMAIRWYTDEKFLFKLVNNLLRSGRHPAQIFCLQPYFRDLVNGVKQLYEIQSKDESCRKFTCYRGGFIGEKEIESLKNNINGIFLNLGFMSTSINRCLSSSFILNAFFIIQVNDQTRDPRFDHGYAFVQQFSRHSYEQQILFNPLNSFKVKSVQRFDNGGQQYYQIELIYGELARIMSTQSELTPQEQDIKDIGEYQLEQNKELFCVGQTLENLKGSEEYCTKFIQIDKDAFSTIGLQKLAEAKINKNKFKEILNFYEQCLGRTKKKVGEKHLQYAAILNKVGVLYKCKEEYAKSLECCEKSRQIFIQLGSQTELEYFCLLMDMGEIYEEMGKYNEAFKILSQCYTEMKGIFGQKHPKCIHALQQLGNVKYRQTELQESLKYLQKVYEFRKKIQGDNHPDFGAITDLMGTVYVMLGQNETALEYCEKTRQIYLDAFGKNHLAYSQVLHKSAIPHIRLLNFERAQEIMEQALQIIRNIKGENSIQFASALNTLSLAYTQTKVFQKAIQGFKQICEIVSNVIGQSHPLYFNGLNNLGYVYIKKGMYLEAQPLCEKCERYFSKVLGQQHTNYGIALTNLGHIQAKQGNYEQSLFLCKRSLQILENKLDKNHPDCVRVRDLIQETKQKMHKEGNIST